MGGEIWEVGGAYEDYIGRWSRSVAAAFVSWLAVPAGRRWLDVGCGTGALTAAVLDAAEPAEVVGVDPSDGFLAHARRLGADPRVRFETAEAGALPFQDGRFDAVVSGLVLNFVPDARAAVAELARVAAPGGTVAAFVWDYAGRMGIIRTFWAVAAELDPDAEELDEGVRFPLCRPEPLRGLWGGMGEVLVEPIEVAAVFRDFEDYWRPFLGGQGPAPAYAVSLPEERRAALRDRLRERLPAAPDGSITLPARAWAVRGVTPRR
ncbi:class I SAM-dependent methyltransferase [Nonomuraea sediminis]|uniref:class I SAM-dependent methyltransferase n=1 Tax=Nonomuraea sediminis TaxID=2835864 RepID=UPI001BDC92CC|nr:class I SAM-dependent methyltransferase [Nonomuraea sediminis]